MKQIGKNLIVTQRTHFEHISNQAQKNHTECVCVIGALHRFQQSFSPITLVAACCMRHGNAWVLSTANIVAHVASKRHKYTTLSHYLDPRTTSLFNIERLANRQQEPFFTHLVWLGCRFEPTSSRL